jgi:sarcosine oxidase gamma subunit
MRNLAEKWPAAPDWTTAVLNKDGLSVRTLGGLNQLLVSGDLTAWAQASGLAGEGVGAGAVASGDIYMVRIARDRILAVGERPFPIAAGWHEAGFAVSVMDAGFHVFEIEGPKLDNLIARGTALDPRPASRSASILFAGVNVLFYRFGNADRARLHVDRGLAPYLWEWLEQSPAL